MGLSQADFSGTADVQCVSFPPQGFTGISESSVGIKFPFGLETHYKGGIKINKKNYNNFISNQ